jgi:dihydroorotase
MGNRIWLVLWTVSAVWAQQYDLLLKRGHVIDPANHIDGIRDVAVKGDRIVRLAPDLSASAARRVVDIEGYYVTPGLVDLHTQSFSRAAPPPWWPTTCWHTGPPP